MFNIDFDKLINDLLPWFLRKPIMISWLRSIVSPIARLHQLFVNYRDDILFGLLHNGQVISLEDMLNKVFNPTNQYPRIYIDDGERNPVIYLYNLAEGNNTIIHNLGETFPPVFLKNQSEPSGFDFTVWVHSSITFDYDQMFSLVNKHKAAGFQFQIKIF